MPLLNMLVFLSESNIKLSHKKFLLSDSVSAVMSGPLVWRGEKEQVMKSLFSVTEKSS